MQHLFPSLWLCNWQIWLWTVSGIAVDRSWGGGGHSHITNTILCREWELKWWAVTALAMVYLSQASSALISQTHKVGNIEAKWITQHSGWGGGGGPPYSRVFFPMGESGSLGLSSCQQESPIEFRPGSPTSSIDLLLKETAQNRLWNSKSVKKATTLLVGVVCIHLQLITVVFVVH